MLRSMLRPIVVAVSAAVVASPAAAQQVTGCEEASARVNTSTLPRVGAAQWNDWVTLTGCGTRGAAVIAGALRSDGVRTETELTRLDHLTNLLDGWFQPSLIAAYEALLRTPDASYAVRLRSMWLLSGLLAPTVDVAGPLQGYMSARCETYDRMTALRDAPNTMPATAYDQARDALAWAADDRTAPEYVRTTARCWEGVVANGMTATSERRDEPADERTVVVEQPGPTTVVVERPVRVVYECDNRFMFYNDAGYDLAVRYGGYGSSGVLRVSHGGPFVWVAARFGPVRFWVGDDELWYSNAVYRPCARNRLIVAPVIYPWYGWHMGLGVYLGHRYVGPRAYGPRVYGPIIVTPPRRLPGNRYDPRGGDRGRRDEPRGSGGAAPRGPGRDGPRRDEPRRAEPTPRPDPRDGAQSGGRRGSAPLPRAPEDRRERFAVPREGSADRPAPPPSAGPGNRGGNADPRAGERGGQRGGDGGRRATPFRGRPTSPMGSRGG